ncbi:unnamed protein product [Calypogeia fissa]
MMGKTSNEKSPVAAMSALPVEEVMSPLVDHPKRPAMPTENKERQMAGSCAGGVARLKDVQSKITGCLGGKFTLVVKSDLEARVSATLGVNAATDCTSVVERLHSSYSGLTVHQAKDRLKEHGPNVLSHKSASSWWKILWDAFWHPFNMILIVLAIISGATGDIPTLSIMLVMVLLSVGLRFWQELTSSHAASKLAELVQSRTRVVRLEEGSQKGTEMEINQKEVVPGDVVVVSSGDLFPGDLRLLTSKDLFVSHSSLTGECMPVEKHANVIEENGNPVLELRNICFMGTSVVSGSGMGIVLTTGNNTYISGIAAELAKAAPVNAFQKGVRRVSYLLICFMLCMVPIVIVISGLTTKKWGSSLLFGISVAVGLTPEMLPMIVNANLARGAKAMAAKRCIVKRLDAIQNLGAMDILCTDKTGTLTIDQVVMLRYLDCHQASNFRVLEFAYLNSYFQTGLRNLLDKAIIAFGDVVTGDFVVDTVSKWKKIDEIPFDFDRRRLSVIIEECGSVGHKGEVLTETKTENGTSGWEYGTKEWEDGTTKVSDPTAKDDESTKKREVAVGVNGTDLRSSKKNRLLITKGALEEMLSICSYVQEGREGGDAVTVPMTAEYRDRLMGIGEELNVDGLRVLVVASKILAPGSGSRTSLPDGAMSEVEPENLCDVSDESAMVFEGFLAFLDPPKESAKEALTSFAAKGVAVKVLTGDTLPVAVKVCKDLDIPTEHVVTGPALALMEDTEFSETVKRATILAKLTPAQKLQVIESLKIGTHTVGFLGDGINDALALKGADVGISVDTASSVAKDAAEIILLEKDLNVLCAGVHRGRITHGNTIKYIKMAASSNFGNVFSILVASAWLPFDPMKPIHILTQNLLYDISQVSIPWDKMDPHYTDVPHQWSAGGITTFMVWMGPISSIFDICTFLTMWYFYGVKTVARQAEFQTAWFLEGLLTQTLVIHMIRTEKIPFIQETAALPVIILTTVIAAIGLAIPWTPIGKAEKMTHLPASFFGFLILFITSYCILAQFWKVLYIRRMKKWL